MTNLTERLLRNYHGNDMDRSDKIRATTFKRIVKRHKLNGVETKNFFLYFIQLRMAATEALESVRL